MFLYKGCVIKNVAVSNAMKSNSVITLTLITCLNAFSKNMSTEKNNAS